MENLKKQRLMDEKTKRFVRKRFSHICQNKRSCFSDSHSDNTLTDSILKYHFGDKMTYDYQIIHIVVHEVK